ncbi:MAG: UPF0261 family protein [Proteobacteria bacterium]|nr:UPF0261 family protein [Pseudomonadota bacterium]
MGRKKGILIICNLDTRGEDIQMVKEIIEDKGHRAILLDFSMEEPPPFPGDITCEEVAKRGGLPIEKVREYYRVNRDAATENQIKGAVAVAQDLMDKGEIDGAFGVGGGTATLVATSVMKKLPFGMPKVMASPMAAHPRYVGQYVGTRDLTMHHTVLDVVKMNPLLKAQITNAVGAICGMVEVTEGPHISFDKPVVAITSFGPAEMCVQTALGLLEDAGFVPVPCHAQGRGDRAMEDMIRDGLFHGVVDVVTAGIVEYLFDGNRNPGPDRLMAASEAGIPQVLAPCGLDHLSYGSRKDKEEIIKSRPHFVMDELRIQVRTTAEELVQAADVIAERLNNARGPFKFLIPLKGWSSIDMKGRPCYDLEADRAFTARLKEKIAKKEAVEEVDLHLYTPEFAKKMVDEFKKIFEEHKRSS